jgi:hypothetical protein
MTRIAFTVIFVWLTLRFRRIVKAVREDLAAAALQ